MSNFVNRNQYETIANGPSPPPRSHGALKRLGVVTLSLCIASLAFAFITHNSHVGEAPLDKFTVSSTALEEEGVCGAGYTKLVMKEVTTHTLSSLYLDLKGSKKHEASDVIVDPKSGSYLAITDNLWSVLSVSETMAEMSASNVLYGDPERVEGEDSGYEALFLFDDKLYVVRESVKDAGGVYNAYIEELELSQDDDSYEVRRICRTDFSFEGDSKGFEGAVALRGGDGEMYVLGLCEGNHCREGKKGKDRGNGKVVVMRKVLEKDVDGAEQCRYETISQLDIPSSANFQDYSAINLRGDRVMISSQEESAVWIGKLVNEAAVFDPQTSHLSGDRVLFFPRDSSCHHIYCNIEGVAWLDDEGHRIVAVSDKMKSKGKQNPRCLQKDQSIHIFALP